MFLVKVFNATIGVLLCAEYAIGGTI